MSRSLGSEGIAAWNKSFFLYFGTQRWLPPPPYEKEAFLINSELVNFVRLYIFAWGGTSSAHPLPGANGVKKAQASNSDIEKSLESEPFWESANFEDDTNSKSIDRESVTAVVVNL